MWVAALIAMLAAIAAAAVATLAARSAGKAHQLVVEMSGTLGRVRAELAAQMAACPECQDGLPDEHARTWRLLAGGK